MLARLTVDPFTAQETAETSSLLVHYPVPLIDHDGDVFVMLDADLNVEWQFANTSTGTCERQPDGTVTCFDDGSHPNGFEWCINAPAVDRNGTVYGLSEDGYVYAIDRQGRERERVFLTRTLAAAYTPLSIDNHGRIYAQNNGELYVLGR